MQNANIATSMPIHNILFFKDYVFGIHIAFNKAVYALLLIKQRMHCILINHTGEGKMPPLAQEGKYTILYGGILWQEEQSVLHAYKKALAELADRFVHDEAPVLIKVVSPSGTTLATGTVYYDGDRKMLNNFELVSKIALLEKFASQHAKNGETL